VVLMEFEAFSVVFGWWEKGQNVEIRKYVGVFAART